MFKRLLTFLLRWETPFSKAKKSTRSNTWISYHFKRRLQMLFSWFLGKKNQKTMFAVPTQRSDRSHKFTLIVLPLPLPILTLTANKTISNQFWAFFDGIMGTWVLSYQWTQCSKDKRDVLVLIQEFQKKKNFVLTLTRRPVEVTSRGEITHQWGEISQEGGDISVVASISVELQVPPS